LGFWGPSYFLLNYPSPKEINLYSICNAGCIMLGGIPSCFIGGYLGDKYESKFPPIKGYIPGFGALISCLFFFICYILQISFWVSIGSQYFAYIFAEVWYGPFFAMVNKIFPSEVQGFGKLSNALIDYSCLSNSFIWSPRRSFYYVLSWCPWR
jgi:hypothetical protein